MACSRSLLALAVLTLAAVVMAPARGDGITVTMTPSAQLVDSQRTTIRGSGFPPFTDVEVLECAGTLKAPPKSALDCDGNTADISGYSDRTGAYLNTPGDPHRTNGYRIWVLPSKRENGAIIRCGPKDPCVLYIGVNFEDFTQPHTFLALDFAGSGGGSSSGVSAGPILAGGLVLVLLAVGIIFLRRRHHVPQVTPE